MVWPGEPHSESCTKQLVTIGNVLMLPKAWFRKAVVKQSTGMRMNHLGACKCRTGVLGSQLGTQKRSSVISSHLRARKHSGATCNGRSKTRHSCTQEPLGRWNAVRRCAQEPLGCPKPLSGRANGPLGRHLGGPGRCAEPLGHTNGAPARAGATWALKTTAQACSGATVARSKTLHRRVQAPFGLKNIAPARTVAT